MDRSGLWWLSNFSQKLFLKHIPELGGYGLVRRCLNHAITSLLFREFPRKSSRCISIKLSTRKCYYRFNAVSMHVIELHRNCHIIVDRQSPLAIYAVGPLTSWKTLEVPQRPAVRDFGSVPWTQGFRHYSVRHLPTVLYCFFFYGAVTKSLLTSKIVPPRIVVCFESSPLWTTVSLDA